MTFDWLGFFARHRVPYVTAGPNVSRGNAAVHCPFCGRADPSEHMSVNLDGRGWACWRNPQHRGKSPVRLVAALLNVPLEQAADIVGVRVVNTEHFLDKVKRAYAADPEDDQELKMPAEFRPLDDSLLARPYVNHLRIFRRIPEKTLWPLVELFDIRHARTGPFAGRIIFPVTFSGRLVSWTGRAIGDDSLRYKTANGAISRHLLWYDQIVDSGANTIYLTEGPMDALKVWALGARRGIVATAFFTSFPSASQLDMLHALVPRFKHRFILLDNGTTAKAMRLQAATASLGLRIKMLPHGVKDPDELRSVEFLLP